MPRYQIVFAPSAERQLLKIDPNIQHRIIKGIQRLADHPFLGKVLKGELREYRAYRVGDYRVIYLVREKKVLIEIIRVAHRREVYR